MSEASLVLRLAGPLQSWGSRSQFNRRETDDLPTKSGVTGLLAAAQGRRRVDPIEDLVALSMGVRVDQPGRLLRDYHTVSDWRGRPLLSSSTNAKGLQKPTSPKKLTHVTTRYYLQDAVFVVVVSGPRELVRSLKGAVERPAFPLALGRRSCVPTQPMLIDPVDSEFWIGKTEEIVRQVPWQAATWWVKRQSGAARVAYTVDDADGSDIANDVPTSFEASRRAMRSRRVKHGAVTLDDGSGATPTAKHDPFALLGW